MIFDYVAVQEYTDDTAEGFRTWRRTVAHNLVNIDRTEQTSLAARVCADDDGMHPCVHRLYTDTHTNTHKQARSHARTGETTHTHAHACSFLCRPRQEPHNGWSVPDD